MVVVTGTVFMLRLPYFPRSVLVLHPLLALMLLGAVRALSWRSLAERNDRPASARPLLILGSLEHVLGALRALKGSTRWHPVGIVSPLSNESARSLHGIPVLGTPDALPAIAQRSGAVAALIASPPGSDERRKALMQWANAGITLLTLPRPDQWLQPEIERSAPRRA